MPSVLGNLRWWIAHLLVVCLAVAFGTLGFWQLGRWQERKLENLVFTARLTAEPEPLEQLLAAVGSDTASLEFSRATARGEFQPASEVLVRSQVNEGVAGFHVITPLVLPTGEAVMVNRGWVPLEMDSVPSLATAPEGEVEVSGWLRLSEERATPGGTPDEGRTVTRVDVPALAPGLPWRLVPLYLVQEGVDGTLPVLIPEPALDDEGPHLAYAIQWFAFAAIGVVGYVFLLRRAIKGR